MMYAGNKFTFLQTWHSETRVNSPSLDAAIAVSHDALAHIINGDPSGYLALYVKEGEITRSNLFGPFARG